MQKCLSLCKSWDGPHPDQKEVIVCNKLTHFKDSHKFEVLYNPEMVIFTSEDF